MDKIPFDVPILFILFNRPDQARQVLDRIRQVRPSHLFVTIDGPRPDNLKDVANTEACKELLNEVDWPCKVEKLIRTENLGCKKAVSSAISWFFEHVEYGIILEDDCVPDSTFFGFCENLLKKYEHDNSVMHIGGSNLFQGQRWGPFSYFFSSIPHIWGWATWRRAWTMYDVNMLDYPKFIESNNIRKAVPYAPSRTFWKKAFDGVYTGTINTWDYQWVFAIWRNQGLCIIPNQNLVSNIGFNTDATHTISDSEYANLSVFPLDVSSLIHPDFVKIDAEAVKYAFAKFYQLPSLWRARLKRIRNLFSVRSLNV